MSNRGNGASRRVVHLTSVHPPTDTRIRNKECASLAAAGYDVTLVVPHDRPVRDSAARIVTVPPPRSRLERVLLTTWRVYRAARSQRAAIYHLHDPELLPVGVLLRRWGHVIYDVHEDVPATLSYKHYVPRPLRRLARGLVDRLERMAARRMSAAVVVTPTLAERFRHEARETVLVQNFPLRSELRSDCRPHEERPMWVSYVGALSTERGLFDMVNAIERVPRRFGAELRLAGTFSPAHLEADVQRLPGWSRTAFLGQLERHEVGTLLDATRVGLVMLHPTENYTRAYATKMFEYMAAGVPVVASDFPIWRKILEQSGAGVVVDPRDPRMIADAITDLLGDPARASRMGECGRRAVAERFCWDNEAARLCDLYDRLTGSPPRA